MLMASVSGSEKDRAQVKGRSDSEAPFLLEQPREGCDRRNQHEGNRNSHGHTEAGPVRLAGFEKEDHLHGNSVSLHAGPLL